MLSIKCLKFVFENFADLTAIIIIIIICRTLVHLKFFFTWQIKCFFSALFVPEWLMVAIKLPWRSD